MQLDNLGTKESIMELYDEPSRIVIAMIFELSNARKNNHLF
jgi:hypothetical protein